MADRYLVVPGLDVCIEKINVCKYTHDTENKNCISLGEVEYRNSFNDKKRMLSRRQDSFEEATKIIGLFFCACSIYLK